MPSNLGKSFKGGKPATEEVKKKKKKGSFLGIISALLEKKKKKKAPMLQYFSWQNIVPDGEGNTDKQKRRYLGF